MVTVILYLCFALASIGVISGFVRMVRYFAAAARADGPNNYRTFAFTYLGRNLADLILLVVSLRLFWTQAVDESVLLSLLGFGIVLIHGVAFYLWAKANGVPLLEALGLSTPVSVEPDQD